MKFSKIFDLTFPVSNKLPKWPESIGFNTKWELSIPININNSSHFITDTHFGTHIDAPLHFIENGKSVEKIDFDKLLGEVFVLEIYNIKSISDFDLEKAEIPRNCKKLILKTDNQSYWNENVTEFQEDFASINESGANWVVNKGINFIGIDYLSIQRFKDGPETHQILLKSGVVIAETLNLANVNSGWYNLICLPMKLEGLEGAPARILLVN